MHHGLPQPIKQSTSLPLLSDKSEVFHELVAIADLLAALKYGLNNCLFQLWKHYNRRFN